MAKHQNMRNRIYTLCLLGTIAFFAYHCFHWYRHVTDDAYISFRYARNLCDGMGLVFNIGERIEGFSNFTWVLISAIGLSAGCDPALFAKLIGLASGIVSILCVYWCFNLFSPSKSPSSALLAPLPAPLMAPLLIATSSFVCYWTFSGMETAFFGLLLTLGIFLNSRETEASHPTSAWIFGLLCLTRPEGVGFVLVYFGVINLQRAWRKELLTPYNLKLHGILLAMGAALLGFRLIYYGDWVPNTFYAKMALPFQDRNLAYLSDFFITHSPALSIVMVFALPAFVMTWGKKAWPIVALLIFNWFFIACSPDWMPNYRFHTHTLPVLFLVIGLGSSAILKTLARRSSILALCASVAIWAFVAFHVVTNVSYDTVSDYNQLRPSTRKPADWITQIPRKVDEGIAPPLLEQAIFLIENTSEQMTVGLRDIGFTCYASRCRVHDRAMLVNRLAPQYFTALTKSSVESFAHGALREDLKEQNPDYFLYPPFTSLSADRWARTADSVYRNHFANYMELVQTKRRRLGQVEIYRKKGLTWRPTRDALIGKYEKLVDENSACKVLKKRLEELRR